MATMMGSGVRYTIIDRSFTSFDVSNLSILIPMMTKRGAKLTRVTYDDYEKLVGYDLNYNSNYLGLKTILEAVAYVDVFRINVGAFFSNVILAKNGGSYSFDEIEDPLALEGELLVMSEAKTLTTDPQTVTLTKQSKPGTIRVYNSTVTVLLAQDDGLGVIDEVAGSGLTGTINYVGLSAELSYSGTLPLNVVVQYEDVSEVALICYAESAGDWKDLAVKIVKHLESLEFVTQASVSLAEAVEESTVFLYDADAILVAHDNGLGLIVEDDSSGVAGTINYLTGAITLTTSPATSTFTVEFFPVNDKLWEVSVYEKTGISSYSLLETKNVSYNEDSEYFIEKVVFENVKFNYISTPTFESIGASTPVSLLYGGDGVAPTASTIDFSSVVDNESLFVCMNGITSQALVSKFLQYFESKEKFVMCDGPNFEKFTDEKAYKLGLYPTNRGALYWISDKREVDGKYYYVYPSVNVMLAYAKMFNATGYLLYPPAGYDYAGVVVEDLLKTDMKNYKADLKINKINYQTIGTQGPVIWEQRTLYAYESDLSYISPNITLMSLASRIKRFLENYGFRLVDEVQLLTIESGLSDIGTDYIGKGFLWSYSADVPTFDDVKASGARFLEIKIRVKVAEDFEETTFIIYVEKEGF